MPAMLTTIRFCLMLGATLAATLSIAALFGFAVWELDLLNHAQILLFPATLAGLLIVSFGLRGQARSVAVIYAFVGLAASANVMVPEFVGGLAPRPPAPSSDTITVMTHNLFGLNSDRDKVAAAIRAEDPDIVVLQEFFGEQATDLHSKLLASYPFFARCRGGKRVNLGLYSRLPFEQIEDGACPNNAYVTNRTGHILARFNTAEDKSFSVLTTHMDWPFPVRRQREQLDSLSAVLDGIEGPLVVAGDFNATPWAYALRDFVATNELVRATVNLLTYPVRGFYFGAWRDTPALLPLDHVMTRGGIVVHDLHAGPRTGSDHLPVVFSFSVP